MTPFRHRLLDGCFILIVASMAFLYGIENRSLRRASEGRVARVAQEILDSNDWIVPHLNGKPRIKKPPGSSWMVAATTLASDGLGVSESDAHVKPWHALFPPACAAILLLGIVYWWLSARTADELNCAKEASGDSPGHMDAKASANCNRGLLAALALGMMPAFLGQGRSAEMDMSVALCATVAFLLWERWRFFSSAYALLGFYLSLALGFLIKGHVVFLIVVLPIFAWELLERRRKSVTGAGQNGQNEKSNWWHLAGASLLLGIVLLWGIPFLLNSGITWNDFTKEGLDRFGTRTGHQESFLFYFLNVPVWSLPWFLAIPLVAWWDRKIWVSEKNGQESGVKRNHANSRRRLWWCWFIVNLIFWSILSAKQRHYTIPWLIPLALLVGDGLTRMMDEKEPRAWASAGKFARLIGVIVAGLLALGSLALTFWPDIIQDSQFMYRALLGASALLFGTGTWLIAKRLNRWSYWMLGAAWVCLILVYTKNMETVEGAERSPEAFCLNVRAHVPDDAILYDAGVASKDAVVLYYLNRTVTPVKAELSIKERGFSKSERQRLIFNRRLDEIGRLWRERKQEFYVLLYARAREQLPPGLFAEPIPGENNFTGHDKTVYLLKSKPVTP